MSKCPLGYIPDDWNSTDIRRMTEEMLRHPTQWGELSHFYAWAVSGLFALAATTLAMLLIYRHLRNYTKPIYQRHIVRILCMVPVYAVTAWLTFRYFRYAVYFELVRGLFEAFAIYEFFSLLIDFLGENEQELHRALANKPPGQYPFPLCCVRLDPTSHHFIMDRRAGAIQYATIRPITMVLAVIFELNDMYCPESMSPMHARVWLVAINAISTSVAMFNLVTLYLTVRKDIAEHRPVTKFLSVKFVIFLTFWQSIIVGVLSHFHVVPVSQYWTPENAASGLQNFLICFEMLVAALWHGRPSCFGHHDYVTGRPTGVLMSMADAFNPIETLRDISRGAKHLFDRSLRGGMRSFQRSQAMLKDDLEPLHNS